MIHDLAAWGCVSTYRIFGDHTPVNGSRLILRVSPERTNYERLLAARAAASEPLDLALAQFVLRAGLGLASMSEVAFVYANTEEAMVILQPGTSAIADRLVSAYSARLSLLTGEPWLASSWVFEIPELGLAQQVLSGSIERLEETTLRRASMVLGHQLAGRGEVFHPAMVETMADQTHLLQSRGIDIESLPPWWWRGAAARRTGTDVALFDDMPAADRLGQLISG